MSKKHPEGVVLASAAPHPDIADRQVTVYWQGPVKPNLWTPYQHDAARFTDEALAVHTLNTFRPNPDWPRVWSESALHQRNGGPVTPVITAPPAGTGEPVRPAAAPEPEQGDLFGGTR